MEKVLVVDVDKCTGCRICELVCSMMHNQGGSNPTKSYIRVMRNEDFDVNIPILSPECTQEGLCVEYCMPRALEFVPTGEAAIIRKRTKLGRVPLPLASKY